jgi:hypothetical protein
MSLAKKSLSPEAQMRVQHALNQTDWLALDRIERLTEYRAAKEAIEARVLADEATRQAREADAKAREETAWLARWTTAGGRYDH